MGSAVKSVITIFAVVNSGTVSAFIPLSRGVVSVAWAALYRRHALEQRVHNFTVRGLGARGRAVGDYQGQVCRIIIPDFNVHIRRQLEPIPRDEGDARLTQVSPTGASPMLARMNSVAGGARGLTALVDASVISAGVDPSWLHSVFTGIADAASAAADGSVEGAISTASVAASAPDAALGGAAGAVGAAVVGAAVEEAANGGGGMNLNPVDFLTGVTESSITGLHGFLQGLGVPNAYGLSIIFFTVLVKIITFPLTYQQLSSTTKMQALSPKVKALQARYANNPEAGSQAIQQLYQTEQVNPLAGCLPAIAQIPIFISLYRSLLNLAKENKLTESFLWIPSLEGPTFDASPTETLDWIKNWSDGVPKLGWHDTLAYLTIPVILILTQSISMRIMQPPQDPNAPEDPAAATTKQVTKFLPLLVGWFSLSVPSALGLYWVLNNFISTTVTVLIRQQIAAEMGQAPAKISLPFMSQEAEVVSPPPSAPEPVSVLEPAAPEVIPESAVEVIEPKGFAQASEVGGEDEVEGQILRADGSPVAVAAAEEKTSGKSKPSSKKRKKKKAGRR